MCMAKYILGNVCNDMSPASSDQRLFTIPKSYLKAEEGDRAFVFCGPRSLKPSALQSTICELCELIFLK